MCNITHADITMGFKTDHSLITLRAALHSNQRGPGYWKLNTSFLSDANYVNQIRTTIKNVTDEYVNDDSVNPTLMWEMIKLKIREQSIKYAKDRKTKTSRREEEIEKEINVLQELVESSNKGDREKEEASRDLEEKKTELEKIIEYRTKGAILRAKCRWHNEGERNTKYFLNLEKRHFKNCVISQLKTGENEFVTSDKEILHQCENFYRDLYKSRISEQQSEPSNFNFFEDTNTLNADEKESCEGLLTNAECLDALKSMEPEKTPGSDGIPAEFYKVFWNDISEHLVTSINHAYQKEQFSVTQRRGIIKLIPKKDAEPSLIKNWRPITLLNCDYKIAAKALANRLKKVLPKLVNSDQTGFMKGRFIGENIRLIDGVINFAEAENIPGLLLFLDFEKAFDTVEWVFIKKTFQQFNFGPSMIKWINICYNNIESCVLNNGWSTDFFKLERGVRQGCPLSPYLFVLGVEILAEKIRKNETIKGITVSENEIKISQYADDTTLILDGSKESLICALQVLENFSLVSGLKLNNRKTEALWIGAYKDRGDKLCPGKNLKWIKHKGKALGVWFSTNPEEVLKANYADKLAKVSNSLGCWELRRLSLLGKITVLKSLIVSQLVYILSPLPTNQRVLEEINTLFFNFLWNGKGDKIKRNTMISDYSEGGLRMIDLISFNKALKSTWVKKYLDPENHSKWKFFLDWQLQHYGGPVVFRGNLNRHDLSKFIITTDAFTTEILQLWSEISYEANVNSTHHFLSLPLWHNSLIRIDNRPVYYKSWSCKGIQNVTDLLKDPNTFLSSHELQERYNVKTNILVLHGLKSSLKSLRESRSLSTTSSQSFLQSFLKAKKPSKVVYEKLVAIKQKTPFRSQEKWLADCELESHETIDWKSVYLLPFKCTKITKLITFQFKLLHRRLATNSFLKKIGVKESDLCTFCKTERESLIHLFWSCALTSIFWKDFKQWITTNNENVTSNFSPAAVLGLKPFFISKKTHRLCLIARYYIWVCRTQEKALRLENFLTFQHSFDAC